jgi:hypothetical protein
MQSDRRVPSALKSGSLELDPLSVALDLTEASHAPRVTVQLEQHNEGAIEWDARPVTGSNSSDHGYLG